MKRKVLSFFLNNKTVLDWRISKGTEFQIFGAQTEKALSPYVLVLQDGWTSRSWEFERRDLADDDDDDDDDDDNDDDDNDVDNDYDEKHRFCCVWDIQSVILLPQTILRLACTFCAFTLSNCVRHLHHSFFQHIIFALFLTDEGVWSFSWQIPSSVWKRVQSVICGSNRHHCCVGINWIQQHVASEVRFSSHVEQ